MPRFPQIWLASLLALSACGPRIVSEEAVSGGDPLASPADPQAAVREAARGYADALAARDGSAAALWVAPETFDLYEDLRTAALTATPAELEARDLLTTIMVLELRARMNPAALAELDGRRLFEQAIDAGFVSEDLGELDLDEVWIDESGTRAEIRQDGQAVLLLRAAADPPAAAEATGGDAPAWRVDLPGLIERVTPDFDALARERIDAQGRLETALRFVEFRLGESVDRAILDTPIDPAG
ncbi:hypothetical protein G6O69_33035 [Pseudenhygromyxa sp. WMMC2535]|uniref:hypothetical protein n=1 Tax=Pseudenhygromyxa sp. WMMC2535 TaxID=2712867 RepID=UPI001554A64D|nr:hypothetical protein [Pseudenhygromyxa sp. WMMC2535]NVB42694.1 hypothetical protein [Pseudenhygromyxa sp. WMMC2535]